MALLGSGCPYYLCWNYPRHWSLYSIALYDLSRDDLQKCLPSSMILWFCDTLNNSSLKMETLTDQLLFYFLIVMIDINLFLSRIKSGHYLRYHCHGVSMFLKGKPRGQCFPTLERLQSQKKKKKAFVSSIKIHCFFPVGPEKPVRTFTDFWSTLYLHC